MNARPYQIAMHNAVDDAWESASSTLVVSPTGTGKTILAAMRAQAAFPRRTMFLAHRKELVDQAADKIRRMAGLSCEIEMGDRKANENGLFAKARVIVSSVQTQNSGGDGGGRFSKFQPDDFACLIIDEAHHSVSASYRRLIDYYRRNPRLKILGITATPDRADEKALGQIFESVAFDYELLDAIADGWLVPIEQQMVTVQSLDFSQIKTTAGDLNGGQLAKVLEMEENLQRMVSPAIEIVRDRRAIMFTASVAHAQKCCEIFNRHRPGMADWVCGKTDPAKRAWVASEFAHGRIQIVVNCAVYTEGFDDPARDGRGVEIILMGRPTMSRALYAQMVGRATRPLPGLVDGPPTADLRRSLIASSPKPSALVVDFVGNAGRHKLMTTADILGGNTDDDILDRAVAKARKSGCPVRMDHAIAEAEAARIREREEKLAAEAARRGRLVAKAKFSTQTIDPFDVFGIMPAKSRGWDHGKPLTPKQRDILLRQGFDADSMPPHHGRQVIQELFRRWKAGLCTPRQSAILKKFGHDTNVSMEQAAKILDRIAAAGWRNAA
jgi:superfamily II DNA or RNA helicase